MTALAQLRSNLPGAAKVATQFAVDNPGPLAVTLSGMVVIECAVVNIVRPRTALQAIATAVLLTVGTPYLARELVRRDVLKFWVRDPDGGGLVQLRELLYADSPAAPE